MTKTSTKLILKQIKTSYNKIANEFSNTRQYLWKDFDFFKKYIKKNEKTLDLGCGNGRLYKFLEKFNVKYEGIDISDNLIKSAKKAFPEIKFQTGSILDLPYKEKSFDKIFCIAVLHHVPSNALKKKAVLKMNKILKNKGYLFLTVWNMYQKKFDDIRKKAKSKNLFIPWGQDKKIKRYYYAFESEELKKIIEKNGFKVVEYFATKDGEKVEWNEAYNYCLIARKNVVISNETK